MARFHEDREVLLPHSKSGWRAYLVALPVVAAVVAVVLLGVAGSWSAPEDTARPSAFEHLAMASSSPFASPTQPTPTPQPTPYVLPEFLTIEVNPADRIAYDVPSDTYPIDADGETFLFSTNDTSLFVLTPSRSPIRVATPRPCGQIEQAAISGMQVIYSEIVPYGYYGDARYGCPANFEDTVDWYVSIVGTTGGSRVIDSGNYSIAADAGVADAGPADAAPRVAITDLTYAFSRPNPTGESAAVEVHRLADDKRLFNSASLLTPVQVRLGGDQLVAVSPGPAWADRPDGALSVLTTTDWATPMQVVSHTSGLFALSRDGKRLAFAGCNGDAQCGTLEAIDPGVHWGLGLDSPATSLSIDSGAASMFQATAWISATDGASSVHLIVGSSDNRIALSGLETPLWVHIQADVLLCLTITSNGRVQLMRLDLNQVLPVV
ncbi:MAG TPA: hypothetical protein VF337_03790 [Candidatus Limnocylindrales bacterium]